MSNQDAQPTRPIQPTQRTKTNQNALTNVQGPRPATRWWLYAIGGLALSVLLMVIFTWQGASTGENRSSAPAGGNASTSNAPGGLDVSVPTIDGGQYSFAEQSGKPVLIFASASWCIPCIGEVPKLAQLHNTYKDQGLQVVALDLDTNEGAEDWKRFKEQGGGADHPWVMDPANKVTIALGVQATDTKIWFNRQGKEMFRTVGITPYEVLDSNVKEILK